ncbi:extracellular solute-binding protein [Jiangella aurantiaca]|uniref:Extracellular solute-binding protein n=1 Tax=Jiangella aurantiaca TaxID=2530373 RepID=A0A4R5A0R1_9ACTN|nr:extracellular solute-binding protein [Jiangella aurantiaca]TDD65291.1 extracellular solute-binding protein [Jiangella aurantiaca]
MTTTHLSRRSFIGAGLAGTLGLYLSGCGFGRQEQAAEGQTTLSIWDSFTTDPVNKSVDALNDAFAGANDGVSIDRNIVQYDQLTALAKTAMASGDGPDLVYYSVGKGNAGILVDAGLLAPLDDLAEEAGWTSSIAPFALREATFDGVLYGLPNESEISGWWYNKSLLDQHGLAVPETADDLLTLAEAATSLGIVPVAYGQGDFYTSFWLFSQLACNIMQSDALGKLVYENDGVWNSPEIVQAIQTVFVDWHQAGVFGENVNALKAQDASDLWSGEQAFLLVNGSWATGSHAEALPDRELGMMPLPSLDGEHRVFSAGSGGAYWLSANAGETDAAKDFLKFVFSDDALPIWIEQAQLVPPVQFDPSSYETNELQNRIATAASGDGDPEKNLGYQVNHGLAAAPFLNMMTEGFQAIIAGDKTPQQQADDLQAAWEEGL